MRSLAVSEFEKGRQCPSSEVLLSYQQRDLTSGQTSQIAFHLAACDFCSAELQLLSRCSPPGELYESPPMPVTLQALAEALLNRNRSAVDLLEQIFEQRTRHGNIRCDDLVSGP